MAHQASSTASDRHALPLVTIGMPVYNEDRFLAEALRSLLSQDYPNFEIVISDNASTDDTGKICLAFAEQDKRIRYFRMERNEGAVSNFRRTMDLAQGKYFMWASGHDLWSVNLISECVHLLERDTNGVIAFGCCEWIDTAGQKISRTSGWTDTRGLDASSRFLTIFWGNMHPILGVIRAEGLRRAGLISCAGTDLLVLSQLALLGDFIHAHRAWWARREFRTSETYSERMKRYRSAQYGLSRSVIDRVFPVLRLPLELTKIVLRSRVSWWEKVGLLGILVPSFLMKYFIGRRGRRSSDANASHDAGD
jgi:glycosyltransferase involved in cell wall biosynthesis